MTRTLLRRPNSVRAVTASRQPSTNRISRSGRVNQLNRLGRTNRISRFGRLNQLDRHGRRLRRRRALSQHLDDNGWSTQIAGRRASIGRSRAMATDSSHQPPNPPPTPHTNCRSATQLGSEARRQRRTAPARRTRHHCDCHRWVGHRRALHESARSKRRAEQPKEDGISNHPPKRRSCIRPRRSAEPTQLVIKHRAARQRETVDRAGSRSQSRPRGGVGQSTASTVHRQRRRRFSVTHCTATSHRTATNRRMPGSHQPLLPAHSPNPPSNHT